MYKDILSRVLIRGKPSIQPGWTFVTLTRGNIAHTTPPSVPNEIEDDGEATNQIPQHDAVARRDKLKEITELGLKHIEDKKVSTTLLGHEIVLQDVVANVAGAVK